MYKTGGILWFVQNAEMMDAKLLQRLPPQEKIFLRVKAVAVLSFWDRLEFCAVLVGRVEKSILLLTGYVRNVERNSRHNTL